MDGEYWWADYSMRLRERKRKKLVLSIHEREVDRINVFCQAVLYNSEDP